MSALSTDYSTLQRWLQLQRVLPVLTAHDPAMAIDDAHRLHDTGFNLIEITLRTEHGYAVINDLSRVSALTVGAGTVRTAHDAHRAIDLGASFLVSPCYDDSVADTAARHGVPYLPGVATATEIHAAAQRGHRLLKLFPAAPLGGPAYIRSVASVFPEVLFVPSGGIGPHDVAAYLEAAAVVAVCGSWMVRSST